MTIEKYLKILQIRKKENKREQLKTKTFVKERKNVSFQYYRYADDWIFLLRGPITTAKSLKKIMEEWLKTNLYLELSPEKTLITDITANKAHFLGFEIFYQINKQVVRRKTRTGIFLQRYGRIQIMPDTERLRKKFHLKNYLSKDDKPSSI
jgi:hypothetical protein